MCKLCDILKTLKMQAFMKLHQFCMLTTMNSLNTMAKSSTFRVNIPGTSSELTRGMRPCLGNSPYVGFSPTMPDHAAGFLTEPPVSDPSALERRKNLFIFRSTYYVSQPVQRKYPTCENVNVSG